MSCMAQVWRQTQRSPPSCLPVSVLNMLMCMAFFHCAAGPSLLDAHAPFRRSASLASALKSAGMLCNLLRLCACAGKNKELEHLSRSQGPPRRPPTAATRLLMTGKQVMHALARIEKRLVCNRQLCRVHASARHRAGPPRDAVGLLAVLPARVWRERAGVAPRPHAAAARARDAAECLPHGARSAPALLAMAGLSRKHAQCDSTGLANNAKLAVLRRSGSCPQSP